MRALQENKADMKSDLKGGLTLLDNVPLEMDVEPEKPVEPDTLQDLMQTFAEKTTKEIQIADTIATDLTTLIYGKSNVKPRKLISRDAADTFRLKIKPRYSEIENYLVIKDKFLVGADYDEEASAGDEMEVEEEVQVAADGIEKGIYVRIELE